jgi:hypothetical protein
MRIPSRESLTIEGRDIERSTPTKEACTKTYRVLPQEPAVWIDVVPYLAITAGKVASNKHVPECGRLAREWEA